ncbi:hypothetical protein BJ912DRAFT_1056570 [Pholiota molesta]|nr:hypothetical protein BJ912DRAFT_1056570 [Pholiota molesta]
MISSSPSSPKSTSDFMSASSTCVERGGNKKVGIARPGKPLILGNQAHPEVNDVVKEVVEGTGGLLFPPVLVEKDIDDNDANYSPHALLSIRHTPSRVFTSALTGQPRYCTWCPQLSSHSRSGCGAPALGIEFAHETIEAGIQNTSWPGRLSYHTIGIKAQETIRVDTAQPRFCGDAGSPLPITYVLGLSDSPPKTPLQTLGPLFSPVEPSDLKYTLNIQPAVALLPFTPPEGMSWVKPVPTATMRAAVSSLLPGLVERDIWTPVGEGAVSPGGGGRNRALEDALRWAAGRHAALVGDGEDGERMPGLVVLAGSLYHVPDFYRLIEGATLILSTPEAEPATVNLPARPSTATILRVPHSRVSYAAQSFGAGDVSIMPPQAAAHFIAAFELMDQEDAAQDEVLHDSLRRSKGNSMPIDDGGNEKEPPRVIVTLAIIRRSPLQRSG